MSGGVSATTAALVTTAAVGALGVGASIYGASKQSSATKKAANAQVQASNDALAQQKEEYNRQNQQQANIESILEQNTNSEGGMTSLTGAEGLAGQSKNLGKGYSLLGG